MENKKLWDSILVQIEMSVSEATFVMWFKDTHIIKIEEGVVKLGVPNTFVQTWLRDKYHTTLLKFLREINTEIRSVEYIVSQKNEEKERQDASLVAKPSLEDRVLPLNEHYINKEDNLNPKYTFDNFVIGPFNELAHAAAQAIIKNPTAYNPLFIYGNTGLGKTHLMQAIANHIKKSEPHKKVFYTPSDKWAQEMQNAIQTNKMNTFKDKYRKYDIFVMDDIQFISNKEKTQEELFHLFNHLYDNNKQIIFSSDVHPNYIPNLENRLKSRFVAGMTVDIPQPDHESRAAILKSKASMNNLFLSEEVINYIASYLESNIRELEGIINNLIVQKELLKREFTVSDVKNLIKNNKKSSTKNLSVKEVIKIIAGFYNIEEDSIYDKTRKREVVRPRQLAMYILREDFNVSYPSIGQKLGGRDHTTVMHSCERVKEDIKTDASLLEELGQIRSMMV